MDFTAKQPARAHKFILITVVIQMGMLQVAGKKMATSRLVTKAPNAVDFIDLHAFLSLLHNEGT